MKAAGYNPKVDFFLALAEFNRFVHEQNLKGISNRRLRDRLSEAKALRHDNGEPYKAPDFWSLYAGLLEPPAELKIDHVEITQENCDEWVKTMREQFRQISLQRMCSRAEAWELLRDQMMQAGETQKDLIWIQEVLAGLHEPTVEEYEEHSTQSGQTGLLEAAIKNLLQP